MGIVPENHKQRHGVRTVTPAIQENSIPASVLAELAFDFDSDGEGTPAEFVEALAFEVRGNEKREVVSEILSSLGDKEEEIE